MAGAGASDEGSYVGLQVGRRLRVVPPPPRPALSALAPLFSIPFYTTWLSGWRVVNYSASADPRRLSASIPGFMVMGWWG